MEQFIWFDIITLGLISILAIKGIINGFIKEVFGLLGIVGGIYLAARYATEAGNWIDSNLFAFDNKSALFLVGFLGVLILFWITCIILGAIITKMLSLSGLGAIDKIAGFIVGGAKIFFVFSVLFLAISNVGFIQERLSKYVKNSFMYPAFIKTGSFIINIKPTLITEAKKIGITTDENKSDSIELSTVDQNRSIAAPKEDNSSEVKE